MPRKAEDFYFFIETLGCPKNRVDSRRMRAALLQAGLRETDMPENADFLIVNSCSFIREAQEETIETVFESLKLKKKHKQLKVGMVGCFAERFSEEVKTEIPELDFLLGTGRYHEIPLILAEKFNLELAHHDALNDNWQQYSSTNSPAAAAWAYFRIAQGCSRHCAFCILPKIRGPLTPYDLSALQRQWNEEKKLRHGAPIREVILVSQDTISQGVDELERIINWYSEKEEVHWIRLQYLFPDRRVLKLLDLWQKYPKLTAYLDMPFQHAAKTVLERMKRPSDTGLFREILTKATTIRPEFEVRTSFIVGFPGETQEEYSELGKFLQDNIIHKLALFRYSHESGTSAGDHLKDTIPDEEKIERINELRNLHLELRKNFRANLAGRSETVLVDEIHSNEIIARREQDSPEIDEVVFLPVKGAPAGLAIGSMPQIELSVPMEYDFIGEWR